MRIPEELDHLEEVRRIQAELVALVPPGWKFAFTLFCSPPDWTNGHHTINVPPEAWPAALAAIAGATLRPPTGIVPAGEPERKPKT